MRKTWMVLSIWFTGWFLVRLMVLSFNFNLADFIWVVFYLIASMFCVTKYRQARKVY